MLEVLQFIFSSFWVFCGTTILASIIFGSLASMFSSNKVYNCDCKCDKK